MHPNIVQIYDVGEDERGLYIVMEYVEGETLADELERRGRLPPEEVVAIGTQLCAALEAAHAAHLVHRDIKPQNVLRGRDGKVKLADFGIARSLALTSHTEVGTILGTAAYLSPEQARGEEVTTAADIYSLGVVLYELLTGQTPFEADTLPQLVLQREQGIMTPPRELVPEIPAALEAVVMRCLALRPEYRPASAAALAAELNPTRATRTTAVLPVAPRRRSRRPLLIVGGAVALAAAVLAIVLASSGTTPKAAATTTVPPKTTAPATTAKTATGRRRRRRQQRSRRPRRRHRRSSTPARRFSQRRRMGSSGATPPRSSVAGSTTSARHSPSPTRTMRRTSSTTYAAHSRASSTTSNCRARASPRSARRSTGSQRSSPPYNTPPPVEPRGKKHGHHKHGDNS